MPTLRSIAQAAVICVLSVNARLVLGQQSTDTTKCVPRKGARHAVQPASTDMFATLVPAGDSADASAIYLATLLQQVRYAFTPPDTIATLSDGALRVWLHADGRLTSPRSADPPLSVELTRALTAAIDSVTSSGGIGPVGLQLRTDSIELRLVFHYADRRTPLSVPFFRVGHPPAYFEFQVDKPALQKPGSSAPTYPRHLRESDVRGEVLMQFVVDQDGQADMRTLRVLKSSHPDFTHAVRAFLPQMRFVPAELNGCKVRQIAQLPFAFKVHR